MKINISGRQLKITDDIKNYILKRASKIESRFGEIEELYVVLKSEKHRFEAEMIVTARRVAFHAESHTHEIFSALDGVIDKITSQIRRYKERVKERQHRGLPHREVVAQLNPEEVNTEPEDSTLDTPSIVSVPDRFASKPMTVAEALTELHTSEESLILFLNSDTQQVNLLYQTDRHRYGWVEPHFT